jgi:hypothetical protein
MFSFGRSVCANFTTSYYYYLPRESWRLVASKQRPGNTYFDFSMLHKKRGINPLFTGKTSSLFTCSYFRPHISQTIPYLGRWDMLVYVLIHMTTRRKISLRYSENPMRIWSITSYPSLFKINYTCRRRVDSQPLLELHTASCYKVTGKGLMSPAYEALRNPDLGCTVVVC